MSNIIKFRRPPKGPEEERRITVLQIIQDNYILAELLKEATTRCIFRLNSLCQETCAVRPFCKPNENGLTTVKDID